MITNPSMMGGLRDQSDNGIFNTNGAGAPVNGTSGTGVNVCGPGSTYFDRTNNNLYFNLGTITSPQWEALNLNVQKSFRTRSLIADVNAGITLLPAIPGYKYRVVDMMMISIGGAAAAATSVDILATLASSSRKLLSVAVAALTQSAVNRAGGANASVLADGASFIANDANTAISIGKTGASVTTATNIDTQIDYVLEK